MNLRIWKKIFRNYIKIRKIMFLTTINIFKKNIISKMIILSQGLRLELSEATKLKLDNF
jgi:hypothetical protein